MLDFIKQIGIVRATVAAVTLALVGGGGAILAVDSYGGLTYAEAVGIKQEGYDLYIQALSALPPQGLVKPDDREASLRNAAAGGLLTAGYALVGCGDTNRDGHVNALDGRADMDYAREGLSQDVWDALLFVAVDVEIRCQTWDRMNVALDRLAELGKPRVVYTSYNWWVYMAGNPTRLPGTILWNAHWDDDCTDNDFLHRPYGGFLPEEILGEQCQGGTFPAGCHTCNLTVVAGQNVDLNWIDLSVLGYGVDDPAECPSDVVAEWPGGVKATWDPCAEKWRGDNGYAYEVPTGDWWLYGEREWSACNGDGLRYNYRLSSRMADAVFAPPGHSIYTHSDTRWSTAPVC